MAPEEPNRFKKNNLIKHGSGRTEQFEVLSELQTNLHFKVFAISKYRLRKGLSGAGRRLCPVCVKRGGC